MAIDTAQKRASVATVASVWNGPSVIPDGTIAASDRLHIGFSYSGIAAQAPGGFEPIWAMDSTHSIMPGGWV